MVVEKIPQLVRPWCRQRQPGGRRDRLRRRLRHVRGRLYAVDPAGDADLIFLGFADPEQVPDFTEYYKEFQDSTAGLPTTAFVLASEDLDFAEVLL